MLQDKLPVQTRKKWNYYLIGLVPLGIVLIGLFVFRCDEVNILLFLTSYLWIFTLELPEIENILTYRRYRFSCLNILVRGNDMLREGLSSKLPKAKFLSRSIIPLLFFCILVYTAGVGNILFVLAAVALRELTRRMQ